MKDVIKLMFACTDRESEYPLKYLSLANFSAPDLIDS